MATNGTVGVRPVDYYTFLWALQELQDEVDGGRTTNDLWLADQKAKVRCLQTKEAIPDGPKYSTVKRYYHMAEDEESILNLRRKRGENGGDLSFLPNELAWAILVLKWPIFIHLQRNAGGEMSNRRLKQAFITNLGEEFYFTKEWVRRKLFVDGATTMVPTSVPTEQQQEQLAKEILAAFIQRDIQKINRLLASAGLPYPAPMLHSSSSNNNNNNALMAGPGMAGGPLGHPTATIPGQMGHQTIQHPQLQQFILQQQGLIGSGTSLEHAFDGLGFGQVLPPRASYPAFISGAHSFTVGPYTDNNNGHRLPPEVLQAGARCFEKEQPEPVAVAPRQATRKVSDEETALKIVLLGPAIKDEKSDAYRVDNKTEREVTPIDIDAPGTGLPRVSAGFVMRIVKTNAMKSSLYKGKNGKCLVGATSNIFIQKNLRGKTVEPLTEGGNEKVKTSALWDCINSRRDSMKGRAHEKKTVTVCLAVGMKKPDDEDYEPVLPIGDGNFLVETEDDRLFSQSEHAVNLKSPAKPKKGVSGTVARQEQDLLAAVPGWLMKVFDNPSPWNELHQALTYEHFDHYKKKLKVHQFDGKMVYELWTLDDGDDEEARKTWPKIEYLPYADPEVLGHDFPMRRGAYPKINGQLQRKKYTAEDSEVLKQQAKYKALGEMLHPLVGGGKPSEHIQVLVYKAIERQWEGERVSLKVKIDKSTTLQDVYDDDKVKSGPRQWRDPHFSDIVAKKRKVVAKVMNEAASKTYWTADASNLQQWSTKELVDQLPVEALTPVHFVLDCVQIMNAAPEGVGQGLV